MESNFKAKIKSLNKDPPIYKSSFESLKTIPLCLTFNDVLMVPQYGQINSRSQCLTNSFFSKNVPLKLPIVSSPMDTVTESSMAIRMAREGGIGIIHRFLQPDQQGKQVEKVKRSGMFINVDPVMIQSGDNYKKVRDMMEKFTISSFLVTENRKNVKDSPRMKQLENVPLVGILSKRDISCFQFEDQKVSEMMTPFEKLIYFEVEEGFNSDNANMNELMQNCKKLMVKNKIQKIPIIKPNRTIVGLVSLKDIIDSEDLKRANKDFAGKLLVGAAVGANKDYLQRAQILKNSGCDVLVLDVANGHSKLALQATQQLKDLYPTMDVVSGSIATGEGAQNLIRRGADGIKCGIGNGSICTTRIVAGSGVPQLSALIDSVPVCADYDIPLCSDGGNKNSGNMCKALAMGASSVMLGRLIAGCDESPGVPFTKNGKRVKMYRGMAGLGANLSKQQKMGGESLNPQTFSAEGVEGYIPYNGPLKEVLGQFAQGIRSGMSYNGAKNLKELRQHVKFIRITGSGKEESRVHDIQQFD